MASNIQISSESSVNVPVASAPGKVRIFRDLADGALKYKNELGVVFDIASIQSYKEPVKAVSTTTLPSYTRLGNIITADANGALPAQDGVTLSVNDSFLLVDAATAPENGIWTVLQVGSGSLPFILERRGDTSDSSQFVPGMLIPVGPEGSNFKSTIFLFTSETLPIVLNTTDLFFSPLVISNPLINRSIQTTDATPTIIATYTTTTNDAMYLLDLSFVGLDKTANEVFERGVRAVVFRDEGGALSVRNTNNYSTYNEDGFWDTGIIVSGSDIQVQVVGDSTNPVEWTVKGTVTVKS